MKHFCDLGKHSVEYLLFSLQFSTFSNCLKHNYVKKSDTLIEGFITTIYLGLMEEKTKIDLRSTQYDK